jgi:hypothetical protein
VLDADGRFFHDGVPVTHPGMQEAFSRWIARHPDDGRYVLNNGYDWTYFRVEDAPFQVIALSAAADGLKIRLSDGSEERFEPAGLSAGPSGALYLPVKQGAFRARFSRSAQLALAPFLVEDESGGIFIDFDGKRSPIAFSAQKA